jgi:hypothetical protein
MTDDELRKLIEQGREASHPAWLAKLARKPSIGDMLASEVTTIRQATAQFDARRMLEAIEIKKLADLDAVLLPYHQTAARAFEAAVQQGAGSLVADARQAYLAAINGQVESARQLADSFRLAQVGEISQLLARADPAAGSAAAFARSQLGATSIQDALAQIASPWIRDVDAIRSVSAFAELQGIGQMLRSAQKPFEDPIADALRVDLGDWRQQIEIPRAVIVDPVARADFYVERGFDRSLTDFPDAAWEEGLVVAGFVIGVDALELPEGLQTANPVEEAGLQRTNRCHDVLQRLERRLRDFIDAAMTSEYGPNWHKQLDPLTRNNWEQRKAASEKAGEPVVRLIDFADFTDYVRIIIRKDHWNAVFEAKFQRKESVQESFQRLFPIRLAAAHARLVTKEDQLFVLAEATRLLKALGDGR